MPNSPNLNWFRNPPFNPIIILIIISISFLYVTVPRSGVIVNSIARMAGTSALQELKEVDIDPEGTFKYILIKVYGPEKGGKEPAKTIVRGYKRCPYHSKFL